MYCPLPVRSLQLGVVNVRADTAVAGETFLGFHERFSFLAADGDADASATRVWIDVGDDADVRAVVDVF